VAVLLVVVGGVGFGAMRLGFFGGTAEAPGAEPAAVADLGTDATADTSGDPAETAPAATTDAASGTNVPEPAIVAPPVATRPAPPATPAAASASGQAPVAASAPAQATAAPTLPETPAVFFRCAGAAQVCSALRGAMTDAFGRYSLRPVANAGTADITVAADVSLVDESAEQVFGTTVINRTYSVELSGEAQGGDLVTMPAASTITYDAALGQQKLADESRRLSMSAADGLRSYWRARRAN
jgi:hypothetical protein